MGLVSYLVSVISEDYHWHMAICFTVFAQPFNGKNF